MLISSARIPTKWDPPVTTNIAASPPRSATGQLPSRRTSAAPAARSATVTTTRTTSGVIAGTTAWCLVHGFATLWLNHAPPPNLGDDPQG